ADQAATLFSRLMAGAISMIFFTYVFVNMGMVSGMLPVVGVPLPFLSYGGTALVTLSVGIGILMSIHRNRMLVQKGSCTSLLSSPPSQPCSPPAAASRRVLPTPSRAYRPTARQRRPSR